MQSQVLFKYRETGGNKWLDNLKLGYGGTQSEMKRLLKDAQKLTGVKYDINNLADVYEAIHAIQEEMGITGTTAEEAEKTISGSLASMKAAWQNVLNGIAGAGDMDALIDSFVDSTKKFVGNITKLIPNLVRGVAGLITGLSPQLPIIMQSLLPGVLDGAVALFEGVAMALPDLVDIIAAELPDLLNQLAIIVEKCIPVIAKSIEGMFASIGENFPQIIQSLGSIVNSLFGSTTWRMIQRGFSTVFGVELPDWNEITTKISDAWNNTIKPGISGFFKTLFEVGLPDWSAITTTISSGWNDTIWPAISEFFSTVFGVELPDWNGIATAISSAWTDTVWPLISSAFSTVFGVELPDWNVLATTIQTKWAEKVWPAIQDLFNAIFMVDTEDTDGATVVERIKTWWANVTTAIANLFSETFNIELPSPQTIIDKIKSWWEGIKAKLGLSVNYNVKPGSTTFTNNNNNTFGGADGTFKTGLDFVPRDNFIARLHQGEAVLTAEEARAWRKGLYGRQEVYHEEAIITGNNFYIQQESDIYDLAVELSSLRRESRRGKGARG